jgi:SpoVK/Ycf46/Vps4 family AAA+-type ATPase
MKEENNLNDLFNDLSGTSMFVYPDFSDNLTFIEYIILQDLFTGENYSENNINNNFDINRIDMSCNNNTNTNNNYNSLNDLINSLDNSMHHRSKKINIHTLINSIDTHIPEFSYTLDPIKRKRFSSPNIIKEKVTIETDIRNIQDLLTIIQENPVIHNVDYNFNIEQLHKIKNQLHQLNDMIGMDELKNNIIDQIIYYIQDFHKIGEGDFMHTVIYGPPGTGKTEVAKIIGSIFSNLGILSTNKFKKVTRADLIAGYLGQTALKTRDVIQECLGGVLFIDEAYALGNSEKRDSFSKECIDTLCEALSDHKDKLMVIVAGYEDELKNCFFSYNQGLDSRFTWRFKTEKYTPLQMMNIFKKKVIDAGWKIEKNTKISEDWFDKHKQFFTFYGRDMETLFSKVKIAHSRRVFCKPIEQKMIITFTDLENGMKIFINNDEVKNRVKNNYTAISTMYS